MSRVWPDPPAQARLEYVRSFSGPADLGIRPRGGGLARWLFGSNPDEGRLSQPFGLALDEEDNLCVTDTAKATVHFHDRRNKTWQTWNRIGKTALVAPVAVAKRTNCFYVADTGLQKVLAFDKRGRLLFELNHPMRRPAALALVEDRLYVADAAAHCILVFDLLGKHLFSFGQRGPGPGEFNFPTHLAADAAGRIYVTDAMNFRIQVFEANGRFIRALGSPGDSSGHFSRPKGVAVDKDGHVYVMDTRFENLQIFNPQGQFLLAVGGNGAGTGEFYLPSGLAIGRDQRIYIADTYNHRIQVLKYLSQP